MTTTYRQRITRLTVAPAGEPIYADTATTVEISDEAAGEFITVSQNGSPAAIVIGADEWPQIRSAIDTLVSSIEGATP